MLLEMEEGCTGFCHLGTRPLFVPRNSTRRADEQQSCAAFLGGLVRYASTVIGTFTVVIGMFLALVAIGMLVTRNDDLGIRSPLRGMSK
mmetsp:Transcript_61102/g.124642  ORF Transcript_61102/g.124642 Transcript_61102/m.124642 type:complete len:89 (-) Transcript_61102:21-287(-)